MKQNFRKVLNGRNYDIADAKVRKTKPATMRWVKRDVARASRRHIKSLSEECMREIETGSLSA